MQKSIVIYVLFIITATICQLSIILCPKVDPSHAIMFGNITYKSVGSSSGGIAAFFPVYSLCKGKVGVFTNMLLLLVIIIVTLMGLNTVLTFSPQATPSHPVTKGGIIFGRIVMLAIIGAIDYLLFRLISTIHRRGLRQ